MVNWPACHEQLQLSRWDASETNGGKQFTLSSVLLNSKAIKLSP